MFFKLSLTNNSFKYLDALSQLKNKLILAFFLCWALAGCLPSPYYQSVVTIPHDSWNSSYKPTFRFNVDDTDFNYQTYLIIRHSDAFPYNNIWFIMHIKCPGDSAEKKVRVGITLAELNGKWMGRGMGEIWEQRMPIVLDDSIKFNKLGIYEISLEQNMRTNPLPEVLNVGLRVEKANIRKMPKKGSEPAKK